MEGCGVALVCVSCTDGRARLFTAAGAAAGAICAVAVANGEEVCQLAGHTDAINW